MTHLVGPPTVIEWLSNLAAVVGLTLIFWPQLCRLLRFTLFVVSLPWRQDWWT
jgi:hypothetical protein